MAQWVGAVNAEAAQNSFFKINQAATPIDPTERRILKSRRSAIAIATRAINRGGTGHQYWRAFHIDAQHQIESLGRQLYEALYLPPLGSMPIKTSDVPVAGRGYSSLPFIFDLVNAVTGARFKDSTSVADTKETIADDPDGSGTTAALKLVVKKLSRVTTTDPSSLGLHPVVYFYTRGGKFQPIAFLAIIGFIDRLIEKNALDAFTSVRPDFERFLMRHKEAFTLIVKSQGSGSRSLPAIISFLEITLQSFTAGLSESEILLRLSEDNRFRLISAPQPIRSGGTGKFSTSVKTATFIGELVNSGVKCGICGALVHRNSMHTDHIYEKEFGGNASSENAQIAHPYCNSTYKRRSLPKMADLF